MIRMIRSLLLLLTLSSVALAADIKLPDKVSGNSGDYIYVTATTSGTVVKWHVIDAGLKLLPFNLLKDTKTAVVTASPGTYRLSAVTADDKGLSEIVETVVTVNGPVDPVFVSLQAAYTANTDLQKDQQRKELSQLYRQIPSTSSTSKMKTVADLLSTMQTVRKGLMPDTALAAERKVIETYLNTALNLKPTATLDATTLAAISKEFSKVAQYLSQLQ